MTEKFTKLYESIMVGLTTEPLDPALFYYGPTIDLVGPDVAYEVGPDLGSELNKATVRYYNDKTGKGKLTNPKHSRNLKIRQYEDQLMLLPINDLKKLTKNLGLPKFEDPHIMIKNIHALLGSDPNEWKVIGEFIDIFDVDNLQFHKGDKK